MEGVDQRRQLTREEMIDIANSWVILNGMPLFRLGSGIDTEYRSGTYFDKKTGKRTGGIRREYDETGCLRVVAQFKDGLLCDKMTYNNRNRSRGSKSEIA